MQETKPQLPAFNLDPDKLKLSQDFGNGLGVKKAINTIPVRKPDKQSFFQVHSDPSYRLETLVLELKEEGETYLVAPELAQDLIAEVTPKVLFTCMSRQKVLFIWPVKLAGSDGRIDPWNESALSAAGMAMKQWIRLVANKALGAYDVYEATGDHPAPEWPDISFREILNIAFKGRYIEDLEHPILRKLRGEI